MSRTIDCTRLSSRTSTCGAVEPDCGSFTRAANYVQLCFADLVLQLHGLHFRYPAFYWTQVVSCLRTVPLTALRNMTLRMSDGVSRTPAAGHVSAPGLYVLPTALDDAGFYCGSLSSQLGLPCSGVTHAETPLG